MVEGVVMLLASTVVMVSGTESSIRFPLSAFLLSDDMSDMMVRSLQCDGHHYLSIMVMGGLLSEDQ